MSENSSRKKQAKLIRNSRKIHRILGISLFLFFFIIAVSGLFLGWKKHSSGILLPITMNGTSTEFKNWLPLDSLETNANYFLKNHGVDISNNQIERIDIRKNKGIIKFIFEKDLWEVQLDGGSGTLLQIGKRHSDLIEQIHDGTILDNYFGIESNILKVIYTTLMSLALGTFTITGFWLWYGPKRMRKGT